MDREEERTDLTLADIHALLLEAKENFKSWTEMSAKIGCDRANLIRAASGRHIPLAVVEFLGLERIEVHTIVYRRKRK